MINTEFWTVRSVPGSPSWPLFKGRFLSRYRFASQFSRGKYVLDVASGIGFGSFTLATNGEANKVLGIEIDETAVSYARINYAAPNLEFHVSDCQELSKLGSGIFDVVVSMGTLEHVEWPNVFAQGVRHVLKEGGVWIVTMLNPNAHEGMDPYHFQEWNVEEFQRFLASHFTAPEIRWHIVLDNGKAKRDWNSRRYRYLPRWLKTRVKRIIGRKASFKVAQWGSRYCEQEDYAWTNVRSDDALEFIGVCQKTVTENDHTMTKASVRIENIESETKTFRQPPLITEPRGQERDK